MPVYAMGSKDREEAKPSRLDRTFCISLKRLVVCLLLVIAVGAIASLAFLRVNMHRRWASQYREAQSFASHLTMAAYLLNSSRYSFETDQTSKDWFFDELRYAYNSLSDLQRLDRQHKHQLSEIKSMLSTLGGLYVLGLNSTERGTLAENLRDDIGWKLVEAYGNFLEYTHADFERGPPFWYFGPSPPDESVLEEVVQLATEVKAKTGW